MNLIVEHNHGRDHGSPLHLQQIHKFIKKMGRKLTAKLLGAFGYSLTLFYLVCTKQILVVVLPQVLGSQDGQLYNGKATVYTKQKWKFVVDVQLNIQILNLPYLCTIR